MSIVLRGLSVRNASNINVIGTYREDFDTTVTGVNRRWSSVDGAARIRYREGTGYFYILTTDTTIGNKVYYIKLEDGSFEQVTNPVFNSEIYANTYYERYVNSGWVIEIDNEVVFIATTTDQTSSPYDASLTWSNPTGVVEMLTIIAWDETSFTTIVSDPVVDEVNGTTTTVTTMVNVMTGDRYTETNVVHNKVRYNVQDITRYTALNLSLGKVYRFQFVSDFAQLGYIPVVVDPTTGATLTEEQPLTAGIFRVDKVLNYIDMVSSGIDLFVNLYQPCRVPREVYLEDIERISDSVIYKLVDPTDKSRVFYMPQTFVLGTPDASVQVCARKLLTVDLGAYASTDNGDNSLDLDNVTELVSGLLEKMYGVKNTGDTVTVVEYDKLWLTKDQRDAIDAARLETAATSSVNLLQLIGLDRSNQYFIENQRLRGKIQALEEVVVDQSRIIDELRSRNEPSSEE